MKEYNYTNNLGYHKKLIATLQTNGQYLITIWSNDTGDFCSINRMSRQQLIEFLAHYRITAKL